jgi:hypothetical protein
MADRRDLRPLGLGAKLFWGAYLAGLAGAVWALV